MFKATDAELQSIAVVTTDLNILRKKSLETSIEEVEKLQIVKMLKLAMGTAWCGGYGLAAVQIGILKRVAWYVLPSKIERGKKPEFKEVVLINPKILSHTGTSLHSKEGCLSIPNFYVDTRRFSHIVYENNGQTFEVSGLEAHIIQHEIDHMDGILCFDREYRKLPGRNEVCSCGSGKKFKKCCLNEY